MTDLKSYWIRNAAASPFGKQARAAALSWGAVGSLRLTWGSADRHKAAVAAAQLSLSSSAPQGPWPDPEAERWWIHAAPAPPPHCPPVSTEKTTPTHSSFPWPAGKLNILVKILNAIFLTILYANLYLFLPPGTHQEILKTYMRFFWSP